MDSDPNDHGQTAPDVDIIPAIMRQEEHCLSVVRVATTLITPMGHGEQHDTRDRGCEESYQNHRIHHKVELGLAEHRYIELLFCPHCTSEM